MEAMYFGVAMYGFPVMIEQLHVAYRLELNGLAEIVRQGVSPQMMAGSI